jgi:hypothetical protein
LLDRSGARENPATADLPADRPFRSNIEAIKRIPAGWLDGKPSANATKQIIQTVRGGSAAEASELTVKLLNEGVAPQSIMDGFFVGAGELLVRAPGILAIHAMTCTNAMQYAWRRVRSDETRRLLLLQNAAFLPLFRGGREERQVDLDVLEPLASEQSGEAAVEEIFAEISRDRLAAARKVLGWLADRPSPQPFADAARRLIFLKGSNSHDYKFSSAVLEDYERLLPPWRDRMLAASVFYLRGSGERDNALVQRTRSALGA